MGRAKKNSALGSWFGWGSRITQYNLTLSRYLLTLFVVCSFLIRSSRREPVGRASSRRSRSAASAESRTQTPCRIRGSEGLKRLYQGERLVERAQRARADIWWGAGSLIARSSSFYGKSSEHAPLVRGGCRKLRGRSRAGTRSRGRTSRGSKTRTGPTISQEGEEFGRKFSATTPGTNTTCHITHSRRATPSTPSLSVMCRGCAFCSSPMEAIAVFVLVIGMFC